MIRQQPGRMVLVLLSLLPLYFTWAYIQTYGRAYPVNDQWLDPLDIAVATHTGELSASMLIDDFFGHRMIFTNVLTAAVAYATDWQAQYELYVIFLLAVVRWLLLLDILRRAAPDVTWAALLPFALLVFSASYYLVWLSGIYSIWQFPFLFGVAALWVLVRFPVGPRAWGGALLLGVCAAFSQGAGLVVLPVLLLTAWLYGYRHPAYYVGAGLVLGAVVWAYFNQSDIGAAGGEQGATITLQDPAMGARFVLAFLGSPFSVALETDTPLYMGLAGVVVALMNLGYLVRLRGQARALAPWVGLAAYAGGVGVLIYLTRYTDDRFIYAVEQRYAMAAAHFWVACVALGGLAARKALSQARLPPPVGVLLGANVVLLLVAGALYGQANIWNWQATNNRYGHVVGYDFTPPDALCLAAYPLQRDDECLRAWPSIGDASPDDIYRLAYYDLSLYDGQEAAHILPQAYQPGAPVLLDMPNLWMGAYVARWWLADVPPETVYHRAPVPEEGTPDLAHHAPTWEGLGLFAALGPDVPTVWYVRAAEQLDSEAALAAALTERGYAPTVIPSLDARYNAQLTRLRFDRLPEEVRARARFDERFDLMAWDVPPMVEPCAVLRLQTWWRADDLPDYNAGLRVQLLGAEGALLADSAAGLSPVPTQLWAVDQLYLDDRPVILSCEAAPGPVEVWVSVFAESPDNPRAATSRALTVQQDAVRLAEILVAR